MILVALLFVGGVIVGHVGDRIYQFWRWRRIALSVLPYAPISTAMPTPLVTSSMIDTCPRKADAL